MVGTRWDEQQGHCGWSGASEGQWERRGRGIPFIEVVYDTGPARTGDGKPLGLISGEF